MDMPQLPVYQDFPAVREIQPAEYFHDCGFARAVLAYDRVDFPFADRQTYIVERRDAKESFIDIP
jgi:hypothetical protein